MDTKRDPKCPECNIVQHKGQSIHLSTCSFGIADVARLKASLPWAPAGQKAGTVPTDEVASMLVYAWNEWGELERWTQFEELKTQIAANFPHVLRAYEDFKHAKYVMDAVIRGVDNG